MDLARAEVRSGLDRAKLLPVGGGYLEATAGMTSKLGGGAFARLEAGMRPLENLTLFGYGQVSTPLQTFAPVAEAGVGLRLTF